MFPRPPLLVLPRKTHWHVTGGWSTGWAQGDHQGGGGPLCALDLLWLTLRCSWFNQMQAMAGLEFKGYRAVGVPLAPESPFCSYLYIRQHVSKGCVMDHVVSETMQPRRCSLRVSHNLCPLQGG